MSIVFATCERKRALEFLQKSFPDKELSDEGAVKDVLDLVEADIIRVGDPRECCLLFARQEAARREGE